MAVYRHQEFLYPGQRRLSCLWRRRWSDTWSGSWWGRVLQKVVSTTAVRPARTGWRAGLRSQHRSAPSSCNCSTRDLPMQTMHDCTVQWIVFNMCTVFIIKVPYGFLRTPRPKLRKKSPSAENTLTQWSSFTNTSPFALTTTDEGRFNYKTHATASDTYAANSQIVHRRLLKSQRHTSWKNVRMNFPLMSNFLTLFDPWLQMKISFLWFIVTPVNEFLRVILFEDNDGNHIYNVFIRQ